MYFLSDISEFARGKGDRDKVKRKKKSIRNPNGGLSAYGRKYYKEKHGSNLKPGVMTKGKNMSLEDMRRKGSWSLRFMGRKNLPPLVKPNGELARISLSASAWGEKPPRTEAEARAIAAKGKQLLAKYHRLKQSQN